MTWGRLYAPCLFLTAWHFVSSRKREKRAKTELWPFLTKLGTRMRAKSLVTFHGFSSIAISGFKLQFATKTSSSKKIQVCPWSLSARFTKHTIATKIMQRRSERKPVSSLGDTKLMTTRRCFLTERQSIDSSKSLEKSQ
jgi:hypothetical protein